MNVGGPGKRTSAASAGRWATALRGVAIGPPLVVAGTIKGGYDLGMSGWTQSERLVTVGAYRAHPGES